MSAPKHTQQSVIVTPTVLLSLGDHISLREIQSPGSTGLTGMFFGTQIYNPTSSSSTINISDVEFGGVEYSKLMPLVERIRMQQEGYVGRKENADKDFSYLKLLHEHDPLIYSKIYQHKAVGWYFIMPQLYGSIGSSHQLRAKIATHLFSLFCLLFPHLAQAVSTTTPGSTSTSNTITLATFNSVLDKIGTKGYNLGRTLSDNNTTPANITLVNGDFFSPKDLETETEIFSRDNDSVFNNGIDNITNIGNNNNNLTKSLKNSHLPSLSLPQRIQIYLLLSFYIIIASVDGIAMRNSEGDDKTPNLEQFLCLSNAYQHLITSSSPSSYQTDVVLLYIPLLQSLLPPQLYQLPIVENCLDISIGLISLLSLPHAFTIISSLLSSLNITPSSKTSADIVDSMNNNDNNHHALEFGEKSSQLLDQLLMTFGKFSQFVDDVDDIVVTTSLTTTASLPQASLTSSIAPTSISSNNFDADRSSQNSNNNTDNTTNDDINNDDKMDNNNSRGTGSEDVEKKKLKISLLLLRQKLEILKKALLLEKANPNTVPITLLNQIKQALMTFMLNPIADLQFSQRICIGSKPGRLQGDGTNEKDNNKNDEKNSVESTTKTSLQVQDMNQFFASTYGKYDGNDDDIMMNELILQLELQIGHSAFKQSIFTFPSKKD